MKTAIIHDWLTGMRGGERCLEVFCELFPEADLYTLLHIEGSMSATIEAMNIKTSFVQKLPFAESKYRNYLPLFPRAIEKFDLGGYDLVLSSSHCVAKGARPSEKATHICYCYTPMRYVWDMYDDYFGPQRTGWLKGKLIGRSAEKLRAWDVASAERVDNFIAISHHVADRIKRHYGRDCDVIYPPVDCSKFHISDKDEDYFLVVSAFAPYKKIGLAIEAFNELGSPLKVVGLGQDEKRLKSMARSNIEFLGWQPDEVVAERYAKCRALIFPGEEDFGITPLEAMSSGRPVIAFARGGALETVTPIEKSLTGSAPVGKSSVQTPTGVFFEEQTVDSLIRAVKRFEENANIFDKGSIREHALKFDRPIFKENIRRYVEAKLESNRCIKTTEKT